MTLIVDLLQTDFFLYWLKEVSYSNESPYFEPDSFIYDVLDAPYFKTNLRIMHDNFERKYRNPGSTDVELKIVEVSLLLFFSYDGVKVRNRAESVFWPGFLTIANLPPTLRNRSGIGTFLILLNTLRNSTVESDVFQHCYIAELKLLLNGIICLVGGTEYFVQARLVHHAYDTKALEKMMCYSAMGYSGCPLCRSVPGVRLPQLDYPYYFGHRYMLPLSSRLRFHGQSQGCCPPNFYTNKEVHKAVGEAAATKKETRDRFLSRRFKLSNFVSCCSQRSQGGSTLDEDQLSIFRDEHASARNRQRTNLCFEHGDAIYKDLKDTLFYIHCDIRPYKKFSRITHESHMKVAREAAQTKKGID